MDLTLSLLWLKLLLWWGFDPWLRNFCMLWVQPKKKKKEFCSLSHSKQTNSRTFSFCHRHWAKC